MGHLSSCSLLIHCRNGTDSGCCFGRDRSHFRCTSSPPRWCCFPSRGSRSRLLHPPRITYDINTVPQVIAPPRVHLPVAVEAHVEDAAVVEDVPAVEDVAAVEEASPVEAAPEAVAEVVEVVEA